MIVYRTNLDGVCADDLAGFFVGWATHPDPPTHLRILLNSHAVSLAIDEDTERVVGFANAISDGILSAYIPLLEVLPEWQGRGIGRSLIDRLTGALDHIYMVDLVCDPELEAFYQALGFQRLAGMVKRNYAHQNGAGGG